MNQATKSNSLQAYQVILYDRALHPELFNLKGRRVITHADYEAELWLMPGAHAFRFEFGTMCASELVTDQEAGVPDAGVVTAFLCAGERDYDHRFGTTRANYMTTVQTESLSENLYLGTYEEMLDHARDTDAMAYTWHDHGPCLSVLDVQRYNREIHAQSYHLIATGGLVLRTQTIFEHD